ncbi:MAG: TSUP family transporter, partial [bacterium]
MNNLSYLIFYVLAFLAEIIGTIGGFGSSLFFVPLANFYFDFHTVLGITAMFHLFSNASKISLFKEGLDKKLIIWIGIPSVIFVITGAVLSNYLDNKNAELYIGLFLSLFSILILALPNIKLKANRNNSIAGGAASGLLAGLI